MLRLVSEKHVITRKQHVCDACLRTFEKGTTMNVGTVVYEEKIYNNRTCITCKSLINQYSDFIFDDAYDAPIGFIRDICSEFGGITPEHLLDNLKNGELIP